MATKPKTTESQAPVKAAPLETMLAKALDQFNAGKLKEAQAAFEALLEETAKTEEYRLGRTVQGYLKAIQARLESQGASTPQAAELTVQVELNHRDPDAALALVEAGLKAHPDHAGLHYLKALALAQLDQAQPAADALTQATSLDPGLIYQFRLEADFDGVRHSAPFAVFHRG
jgi:predicted Zn-dependent protease